MAWPRIPGVWRVEHEFLCGSETFKNHFDILEVGFVSGDDDPPTVGADVVTALTNFYVDMYYPDVEIVGVKLRNIYYHRNPATPEEHPPISEAAIGVVGAGNTTFGGAHNSNYLPADVAIYCKKSCALGRNGKLFMRNILTEVDVVSAVGGQWAFSSGAGHFDIAVFDAQVNTRLAPFFGGGSDTGIYDLAVTHLENIPLLDTRTPYATALTNFVPIRPVWNKAHR